MGKKMPREWKGRREEKKKGTRDEIKARGGGFMEERDGKGKRTHSILTKRGIDTSAGKRRRNRKGSGCQKNKGTFSAN